MSKKIYTCIWYDHGQARPAALDRAAEAEAATRSPE